MKYYNYWDGDYFVRHMMISALRREGWSFSTDSGARRMQMDDLRELATKELFQAGATHTEVARFPSSVEMDLVAEREDEVLAIEIKTRLFARVKAEKVSSGFHHSTMHFGAPQSALKALRLLQGNKGYDQDQDEMGTICEFYRYFLALNALTKRHERDVLNEPMSLFNQYRSLSDKRSFKTAVLVPFYCEVSERLHIMNCLRKLQKLLVQQGLQPFPISLWVLSPTSELINEADLPPNLRIDVFDKTEDTAPAPPSLDLKNIHSAYKLTLARGNYRGCSKCSYRKLCLRLEHESATERAIA